jgi:hypothetical protein
MTTLSRLAIAAVCGVVLAPGLVLAQQTRPSTNDRYFAYDQFVPPGVAGVMAVQAGKIAPYTVQSVRLHLPTTGTVTLYDGSPERPVALQSPAQAGVIVGPMYRLKLSDLPEFPNADFYPSIELVDRLHPPPGMAERFPIEIEFDQRELAHAANGRLVTKVVYLEQPDRVPTQHLRGEPRVVDLAPFQNAVAEADLLGRPIAIVRLGGRTPDPHYPDPQFWGPLAPVTVSRPAETAKTPQARYESDEISRRVTPASAVRPASVIR